ncbi:MAG: MaoC family dehydratase N-terminal domain-containing protein [Actinomycetota bacterium]|nr:MaoC family dehydratase N-terminal domain-containing protein [Actinomycetota bacterium]
MGLNSDLVGKEYGGSTFEVTADAIEQYARATNDENERYLSGEDVVAPPVFPVVPAFNSFMEAGMDPELEADLLRLVHGAEEHVLYKPIRPGDRLSVSTVLESVDKKETGETFTVKATETTQDGEVVAEVRGTMFIRGSGTKGKSSASTETSDSPRKIVHEETTKVDDDQTHRYAEASGDHNPIHLDPNTAAMAGLPGIILHGMCTMAIAAKAAVNGLAGGDPTRIKRVGVRLSKPVLPGQELTTKLWQEEAGAGTTTFGFETYNPDGAAVIKNGVVEIADA